MEFRRRCIDGGDPVVVVIDRVVDDDRRDAAIDEDPIAAVVVDHIVLDDHRRALPNIDASEVACDFVALYQGSLQSGSDTVAATAGDGEALDGEVPLPIRLLNPPLIN